MNVAAPHTACCPNLPQSIDMIAVNVTSGYSGNINCYELQLRDPSNATVWRQQITGAPLLYAVFPQAPIPGCGCSSDLEFAWMGDPED
jgi:hypothetical protein